MTTVSVPVFAENAEILSHQALPGDWYHLRLRAPRFADQARPGNFARLACDPGLSLRLPLPVMRGIPRQGVVEFLYRVTGLGTRLLSQRQAGEVLTLWGPMGNAFTVRAERPRTLLIGSDAGIAPTVFMADTLWASKDTWRPLVLLASETPLPFTARPSQFLVPGMPPGVIGAVPLLEDWGIPSRLAGPEGRPGCHNGPVTDLAHEWLSALESAQRKEVEIFACGPFSVLEQTAVLAREFQLPCQVFLEEVMACAGTLVKVYTDAGHRIEPSCPEGPVFEAAQVFPRDR